MKNKNCQTKIASRLNRVGGEAVLDGVMMKAGEQVSTAVRLPSGAIQVLSSTFTPARKKHKWMGLPFIRGTVGFIESLKLSMSVLTSSAELLIPEDEKAAEKAKEKKRKSRVSLFDVMSFFSVIIGLGLALFLFMYLPNLASRGLELIFDRDLGVWKAVTGGIIKVIIFILYLKLVSLLPDIRRTFAYHGAEHKSIACFEAGAPLTPSEAKKFTRFHPRCGTSFMFVMILLGIVLSLVVRILCEHVFRLPFPEKFEALI